MIPKEPNDIMQKRFSDFVTPQDKERKTAVVWVGNAVVILMHVQSCA